MTSDQLASIRLKHQKTATGCALINRTEQHHSFEILE